MDATFGIGPEQSGKRSLSSRLADLAVMDEPDWWAMPLEDFVEQHRGENHLCADDAEWNTPYGAKSSG